MCSKKFIEIYIIDIYKEKKDERVITIAFHRRSIMIALRKVLAHRIPVSATSSRVSREFNRLEKRANRKMALSRRGTPNS